MYILGDFRSYLHTYFRTCLRMLSLRTAEGYVTFAQRQSSDNDHLFKFLCQMNKSYAHKSTLFLMRSEIDEP